MKAERSSMPLIIYISNDLHEDTWCEVSFGDDTKYINVDALREQIERKKHIADGYAYDYIYRQALDDVLALLEQSNG